MLGTLSKPGWAGSTRTTKHAVALSPWEQAQRSRAALEEQAQGSRTRAGYNRVLDQFRAIYHDNPRDAHAAEAVYSVAELLAEEGRELDDEKSLRAAIGQFEFLRKEYPTSPLKTAALLAEGHIDAEDLDDAQGGREKFAAVLKKNPRGATAKEARAALAGLTPPRVAGRNDPVTPVTRVKALAAPEDRGRPALAAAPPAIKSGRDTHADSDAVVTPTGERRGENVLARRNLGTASPLAAVTGIRHWSTPTYTRVAIDLGDEVTFEAARVPNPDRIYFDLHGAKLEPELIGRNFEVTDDGFLKKIRAAQATGDVTRVVLDVNDVTEYSAFLLPNPYRLIIDIHGARSQVAAAGTSVPTEIAAVPVAAAAGRQATAAANRSGLPAMAVTDGGDAVRLPPPAQSQPALLASGSEAHAPKVGVVTRSTPARPVPNTVTVKVPATTLEVAAVSDAPGKVEATSAPTSKPIAAVVNTRTSVPKKPASPESVAGVSVATDVMLGTTGQSRKTKIASDATPAKAADRTSEGETSLVRALGLKIGRIVIDAGHGGHDSGTLGVDGIEEKDVVLDVALRLGKLLHERLGAEIIYTRSDDTFIPLETRTAIANKAQADLFLSIHANSSQDDTARGVETYYLNFTSDATALDVAARENAVGGQSIHQLSDLVKKITLKDKIAESREFAQDVEDSLYGGLAKGNPGLKNRGVKKAPFVVLIGANMPSILAEISFVTNARDAAQLREPEYRQRVAESLYTGVAKYEAGLAGTKIPTPAMVRAAAR